MATGKSHGMLLLDNSLRELVDKGLISGNEAYMRAINPNNFKQFAISTE